MLLSLLLVLAALLTSVGAVSNSTIARTIRIDASNVTGKFENLQGTNNADTSLIAPGLDTIHDMDDAIASLWPENGIKHVLIYTWPDVFMGFGKEGTAGDPTVDENYNWTLTDKYIKFVTSHGAKASIQFNPTNATNTTLSSPEILREIGFKITNRYNNGANSSGFNDTIDLFDFYAESDNSNIAAINETYANLFPFFAAFARGVAQANSSAGVGAWGGNRILPPTTNYTIYNPFITQFYKDCFTQNIPLKAATYHFTNTQFSFNPHDASTLTDRFRQKILVPAGLPDLPIWITEYEPNPSGIRPVSADAIRDYDDPAFFAGFMLATSMYLQDSSIERIFSWTGFGFGGVGAGGAQFNSWFNKTTTTSIGGNNETEVIEELVPLNVARAWRLQAELVLETPYRVFLEGREVGDVGFAALAGRSSSSSSSSAFVNGESDGEVDGEEGKGEEEVVMKMLLNNYQVNYDILREITKVLEPFLNTSTTAYPLIQENGLFNGEQACFLSGNSLFSIPLCQIYLQATIRNNTSTSYRLIVDNLPWEGNTTFKTVVKRVGDVDAGGSGEEYARFNGVGNILDITVPFPANTQDLVTISRA